jgi:hypothetical protein
VHTFSNTRLTITVLYIPVLYCTIFVETVENFKFSLQILAGQVKGMGAVEVSFLRAESQFRTGIMSHS